MKNLISILFTAFALTGAAQAQQIYTNTPINVGTTANDRTGDTVRDAFIKANRNFTNLYDWISWIRNGTNINKTDFNLTQFATNVNGSGGLHLRAGAPLTNATIQTGVRTINFSNYVVNVKDAPFGAKGDSFTDDTGAIHAACSYLSDRGGGKLIFPRGTYLADGLQIPGGIVLEGEPGAVIKRKTAALGAELCRLSGANGGATGITFDADGKCARGVVVGAGATNFMLDRCRVLNVMQSTGETVSAVGVRIEGGCSGVSLSRTLIKNIQSPVTGIARGILASDSTGAGTSRDILIEGCRFEDIGPVADGDAICVQDYTEYTFTRITGNFFKNCRKRAVKAQAPGIQIIGNQVQNDNDGISSGQEQMHAAFSLYAHNCSAEGNQINGGSFLYPIEVGASGGDFENITVANNQVSTGASAEKAFTDMVRVFGATVANLVISHNVLVGGRNGVYVTAGVVNGTINGNIVQTMSQSGIRLNGDGTNNPRYVSVNGNSFKAITQYGVSLSAGSDITCMGNVGETGFEIVNGSQTVKNSTLGNYGNTTPAFTWANASPAGAMELPRGSLYIHPMGPDGERIWLNTVASGTGGWRQVPNLDGGGNLILPIAGGGLRIKSGTNSKIGTATLSGGTVIVTNTSVTANSQVLLTPRSTGTLTNIPRVNISAGVGFTILTGGSGNDATIDWTIIERLP